MEKFFDTSGSLFKYIFSTSECTCFLESSHQGVFQRLKKLWNIRYLACFSKGKTEECDQENWSFSDKFGITIPCSATYFVEAGARVSF